MNCGVNNNNNINQTNVIGFRKVSHLTLADRLIIDQSMTNFFFANFHHSIDTINKH